MIFYFVIDAWVVQIIAEIISFKADRQRRMDKVVIFHDYETLTGY
jgi:hypothetical protein